MALKIERRQQQKIENNSQPSAHWIVVLVQSRLLLWSEGHSELFRDMQDLRRSQRIRAITVLRIFVEARCRLVGDRMTCDLWRSFEIYGLRMDRTALMTQRGMRVNSRSSLAEQGKDICYKRTQREVYYGPVHFLR